MSLSFGGQRSTQRNQSGVDPQTMQWLQQMMDAAKRAGTAGPSPLTTGASGYNTDAMKAGNLGMGALSGDPSAVNQLMNPYQANVIDAMRREGAVTDQRSMNAVNDAATKAGAFGGSRHGVATGVALGENARNLNSNIAGLLDTGFNNTMGRAGQMAAMGFNAAGANANLGMGGVGSPDQWMLEMMRRGFVMPTGQTSSGSGATFGGQAGASIPFLSGK